MRITLGGNKTGLDQPQVLLNAGEVHNLCHEANTGCKPPAVTFRTLKPSTATASRCSSQSHLLRRRAQRRSADWTGRFAAASFTHFLLFDEQRGSLADLGNKKMLPLTRQCAK